MTNRAILLYATTDKINQLTGWGLGLITGLLILRLINDFLGAINDPDVEIGFKEALKKCRRRVYAALIALTIDSLVLFFQGFY